MRNTLLICLVSFGSWSSSISFADDPIFGWSAEFATSAPHGQAPHYLLRIEPADGEARISLWKTGQLLFDDLPAIVSTFDDKATEIEFDNAKAHVLIQRSLTEPIVTARFHLKDQGGSVIEMDDCRGFNIIHQMPESMGTGKTQSAEFRPASALITPSRGAAGGTGYQLVIAGTTKGLLVLGSEKLSLVRQKPHQYLIPLDGDPEYDRLLINGENGTVYAYRLLGMVDGTGFTTTGIVRFVDDFGESMGVKKGETYADAMSRKNREILGQIKHPDQVWMEEYLWSGKIDESELNDMPNIDQFLQTKGARIVDCAGKLKARE